MTTGYCVKCRQRVEMVEVEEVTMRNNKKAEKGKCPSCGKYLYRIKTESREGMW